MTRNSKELLALALGLALAACNKAGPPLTPGVAFVSPIDGATLTADAGTVAGGVLTFEVTASVANAPAGSSVALDENGIRVPNSMTTVSGSENVQISVALAGGSPATTYPLELILTNAEGLQLATATISIRVFLPSSGACPITISPPTDSLFNETGTQVQSLNTVKDEDLNTAGMQAKLTVTVGSPCADGIPVTLTVGSAAPLTATLAGGIAVFDEVDLPDSPITALSNPNQALTITAAAGTGADASTDSALYDVYSQNPTISITYPADGAIIPQADNPVDVMGITDLAAQLQLFPLLGFKILATDGGVVLGSGNLESDGGFSLPVTLPVGVDVLTAEVTDAFENVGTSASVTVTVTATGANCADAGKPSVMFSSPTPDAGFNLADDENGSEPGFQTPLRIATSSVTGLAVFCSTVAPTAVGASPCPFNPNLFQITGAAETATVSGGMATLDAATLGDDGAAPNQTLTAQVTDGTCGMTGEGSVTVEVHALQPVIDSVVVDNSFVSSDGGCIWLNAVNLQNGTAQTTVVVTVDGADQFADGGPVLAITGTASQTDSAPLTGSGTPSAQVPISLPNGAYNVSATITDVWGNQSAADQLQICVKTTLPTCTLSDNYSNGCFNIADNAMTASNGAVPVTLTISAANASATGINGNAIDGTAAVTINGGGGDGGPIASVLSVTVDSSQGADVYSATVTDPAGNPPAVCIPASLNVTVSTVAPTFTVSPQSGSGIDDAGCEIYSTRDGILIDVTNFTDIANGTSITLQASGAGGGSTAKTSATVANGTAAATLNGLPNGIDMITASATDSCANPGTESVCIDVQAAGCDLSLVSPTATATDAGESVVFNASQVANGTAGIEFHTSCATGTQVQFDSTASGGSAQPQDGGVDMNGDVTFDLTNLVDGSTGTFTADISGGESLPTISYDAKLSLPGFTGESPLAGNLEIVANQDNLILSDAGVTTLSVDGGTIIASEPQCTTTACADFTLIGISGLGPVDGNGNIGTATLTLNFPGFTTSNPNPIPIASGTNMVTFSGVNMPAVSYPTAGTVTFTLTDNVGNTTSETWEVTTDSLQPQAPTLTATMSNKRTASVLLSWTNPATAGDSAIQGYQLAYVINNLGATPPTSPSEAAYATWKQDPAVTATDAGGMLTYTETGLPTLNQYTFELRAIDAVDNRSPLATDATAVSVSAADGNAWQTLTITENDGNQASSDFGYFMTTGDFNGDRMQDLVITAPYQFAANPTPGIVYIMNGAANLGDAGITFAGLTSITLGGNDYDFFGQDAHVADYNGDGVDDLAVGAPYYNAGQGRIDIFFGNNPNGLSKTPNVTIFGDPTQVGYFGYSVSSADVNGDGIPDLLVGAPGMGSGSGSVYVFLSSKNWPASATNSDAGVTSPSATSIISGNPGDGIGAHNGTVPIGDINSDGDGDFAVGAPGGGGTDGLDAGSGIEYGISGASVLANASISVSNGALFTLVGRNPGYCAWGYNSVTPDVAGEPLWECYGVSAIGDVSFTGGKLPDLIVSSAYYSAVYLYEMTSAGPVVPQAFSDDEGNGLGWTMVASDINADGSQDLLVGPNDTITSVYLYLNTGSGLTALPSGQIPSPGDGSYFGYAVTAGDLQNIGMQDFAISDDYPNPYVNVYY